MYIIGYVDIKMRASEREHTHRLNVSSIDHSSAAATVKPKAFSSHPTIFLTSHFYPSKGNTLLSHHRTVTSFGWSVGLCSCLALDLLQTLNSDTLENSHSKIPAQTPVQLHVLLLPPFV